MNRYLSLTVLIIIYSFCCHFISEQPQAIIDTGISLVDHHQNFDDPIDDNGKLKVFNDIPQTVLVLIVLSITCFFSLISSVTRRLMQVTTIFYQSNYLINSLK
ncbi:hypothetical protein JOD29_002494 [Lysinibacillus composti]|nr:hypothetical protein [Lysinibacillus composti]